jgi:chromosome segregation ATPase
MNLNWELLFKILAILAPLLASIPGIYAIRRQLRMEKVEKESMSADIATKYVDAAGDLQDFYTELIREVKTQLNGCKLIVSGLEERINTLTEENVRLIEEINEMKKEILTLPEQIVKLGQKKEEK